MFKNIQKKNFYDLILGFFIKKGNKYKAKKILDNTFSILKKETKKSLPLIMGVLFFRLRTVVEIKKSEDGKTCQFSSFCY